NTLVYEQVPCDDQNYAYTNIHTILRVHHNSFTIVRSVEYHIDQSPPQDLEFKRLLKIEIDRLREDVLGTQIPNPPFYLDTKESDDDTEVIFDNELFLRERNTALVTPHAYTPSLPFLTTMEPADTLLIGDEDSSTNLVRETDKFIKSSVDDLVSIPRESEVTLDSNLECDMPVNTPLPTTDVKGKKIDINSPLGEHVVDFLIENEDIADLPRHLVKQLLSHLVKNPSSTKRMSDKPLGDDLKPRSYYVTFSNSLFDFNDDYTLCYDIPLFDDEFEDIIGWEDEGDGDPFFWFSSYAITPSCCILTEGGDVSLLPSSPHIRFPYDHDDHCTCFQSSNHSVSDHLHAYI
ncbi:hypothetical protein Tco_0282807, partial [Tanacetum coccineum]